MFVRFLLYVLVLLCLRANAELITGKKKLKILVNNPSLGFSHMQFHGKLADLLFEAGHEVDVFCANWTPFETRTGVEKARVIKFNATTYTKYHEMDYFKDPFKVTDIKMDTDRAIPYVNTTLQFCRDLVNHPTMLDDMRRAKYDVMIGEIFDPCLFYVAETLKIKKRVISSAMSMPDEIAFALGVKNKIEKPINFELLDPRVFASSADVPVLSWSERLTNLIIDFYHPMLLRSVHKEIQTMFKTKLNVELPTFGELIQTSSYVFINAHAHLDHPRPITNKIQFIGGIAVAKPRTQHTPIVSAIFDKAPKGVIYFSLGSLVDTQLMPKHFISAFINAFARFPQYSVIWRFHTNHNDSALFAQAPNVYTVDWADQVTILSDPRTQLFISHCGQNSAMESAMSGVPVLGLPLFADQNYNAALLIRRGMSLYQNIRDINEEELVAKIGRLLNEPSFKKNAGLVSRKLNDEPFKPSERFVRLIEYAAGHEENGDLELYAIKLGFVYRNNLDIYVPLAATVLVFLYTLIKTIQLLRRLTVYLITKLQKQKVA
ncbi:putative UDP-glucuronosyltransferase ugt-48 [Aphelenchoides besseyi]|nr:putative UDP-glucuronosyltransferase ugt-48 [Aphelenchoides besseyi]KAI6221624.1 putative UDP-glucuronosyltransferase ugt-48 [Aphelenchoides besseyi]